MFSHFFVPSGFDAMGPTFKLMARFQCETLALLSRRAKAYADLPKTLATCQSPEDLITEQVRFWQMAQRNYVESYERALAAVPLGGESSPSIEAKPAPRRDYLIVSERPALPAAAAAAMLPSTEAQPVRVRRSA